MAAPPTMINAVASVIEELRLLLREELRDVSDGLNGKLEHLEDRVQQIQTFLLLGQQLQPQQPQPQQPQPQQPQPQPQPQQPQPQPQQPQPQNRHNRHWTRDEIERLIELRVQYPVDSPANMWSSISTALGDGRTPRACSSKWYSLVEVYEGMVRHRIEIDPESYFHDIRQFLAPVPDAAN